MRQPIRAERRPAAGVLARRRRFFFEGSLVTVKKRSFRVLYAHMSIIFQSHRTQNRPNTTKPDNAAGTWNLRAWTRHRATDSSDSTADGARIFDAADVHVIRCRRATALVRSRAPLLGGRPSPRHAVASSASTRPLLAPHAADEAGRLSYNVRFARPSADRGPTFSRF